MSKVLTSNILTMQRESCERKYKTSRMYLLILVIATAVNMVLVVTKNDTYFLFSAFIPYFLTSVGMILCGRYPSEYYGDQYDQIEFYNSSFFYIVLAVSIVITLIYLLAYFLSNKQRGGWLVFALVFFGIDTFFMAMMGGISLETIIDVVFHALVIYYLIVGIKSLKKLKKLFLEAPATVDEQTEEKTA